jgi:CheY-like chemotaxis protein
MMTIDAIRKGVRAIFASDFTDPTLDQANGQEVFDFAIENRPDLVILDINMPVLGWVRRCDRTLLPLRCKTR